MNDKEAFIDYIRAHPDDDVCRLVYADWLQEQAGQSCPTCGGEGRVGDHWDPASDTLRGGHTCGSCHGTGQLGNGFAERAEFIRVQCRLTSHPHHHTADTGCPLRKRERGLLESLTFGGIPGEAYLRTERGSREYPNHFIAVLRRGFVDEVVTNWADWLAHHEAVLAHPDVVLRRVELTTWPDDEWLEEADLKYRKVTPFKHDISIQGLRARRLNRIRVLLQREIPGHCSYEESVWVCCCGTSLIDGSHDHNSCGPPIENRIVKHHPIEWVLPE